MSLDWDVTRVKDVGKLQKAVTDTLVWATMSVGLREITEKNADLFYARLETYERLFGPFMWSYDPVGEENRKPRPITPQDVRDHIGLRTNVSSETHAVWWKRMGLNAMLEAQARYRKET
jgi:hypothetical protein